MHKSFIFYFIFVVAEITAQLLLLLPFTWNWSIALIAHSFIALTASFWINKSNYQQSLNTQTLWIGLFMFIFFLPIISAVILWLLDKKDVLRNKYKQNLKNKKIKKENPESYDFLKKTKLLDGSNKIKNTRNLLSTLNDENYLKLLIASRHLPDKEAYALLKEALESPFESARLMAFSLKGKLEQRLQNTLQKNLILLEAIPENKHAKQHIVIARDYLHLLDTEVLSNNEGKLLQQAHYHCIQSIKLNKKSASSYQTLSKIFTYQGKIKQSYQAKKIALSLQHS